MLKVSANGRFLVRDDGTPFFWLGDTAWELFHRLTREDAEIYLRDRAAKGFTVIQAVALAEFEGLDVPNAYGNLPLANHDPEKPLEPYWEHVDWIVAKAAELGLTIGLLPTWGDKVVKRWGAGPEIFHPQNARAYGAWIGRRYRDQPVIWINGGDRAPDSDDHFAIFRALGEGLREGDGGRHLMTFHPQGGRSSGEFFHADGWLDLNMFQSGHHARDIDTAAMLARDYARTPPKPVLDGEPCYEDHPINWRPENGWFDDWDVRKAVYGSVFAGGCGVTYGCHDIWQFLSAQHRPVSSARTPWQEALKLPGSSQMKHLKRLMLARPYLTRVPDPELLPAGPGEPPGRCAATRDADGSYAFLYTGAGNPITVDLTRLDAASVTAWWYSPRDGGAAWAGTLPGGGQREFTPPSSGPGHDWVLVLDDTAAARPAPGIA